MKKLIVLLIALLVVGCAELQLAADIVDVVYDITNPEQCAKPDEIKVYKTDYRGATFYKISGSDEIFTNWLTAASRASAKNTDNELTYDHCVQAFKEKHKEAARRSADKNAKWELIK
jgi:hypothetical protein